MKTPVLRSTAFFLCIAFSLVSSGCARLQTNEYAEHGYKGVAEVKEGKKILVIDWLGNFFGIIPKILLWNWKVQRHAVNEETEQAIDAYLKEHGEKMGNLSIQLNRYAPQDSWRRLFANKGVKWPYRYTLGILTVLIIDTILVDRIFGGLVSGDRYNPYTHTLHIQSDLPSIALHELGHAHDFSERRYRGSYALLYALPGAPLYHEYQATSEAFRYIRAEDMDKTEVEAYEVLYPAYGTYVGGIFGGVYMLAAVVVGHIVGRLEASEAKERHQLEARAAA